MVDLSNFERLRCFDDRQTNKRTNGHLRSQSHFCYCLCTPEDPIPFLPPIVLLNVLLGYLLTQDDDLLASISRGRVVRDVHDLQFLLGLGIIDWSGAHWGQDHCVLAWRGGVLQEYLLENIPVKYKSMVSMGTILGYIKILLLPMKIVIKQKSMVYNFAKR